jgi:hypothetical protein
MSAQAQTLALPSQVTVVYASPPARVTALTLHLPPYGIFVGQA